MIRPRLASRVCLVRLAAIAVAGLVLGAPSASAQDTDWIETTTPRFAVLSTRQTERELSDVLARVDALYDGLATAFGTRLDEPIGVRIHPSIESYLRANPLVVETDGVLAGTRRGRSEIEVIASAAPPVSAADLDNAMRREIARLLAARAADGHMPEGLLSGVGSYMQVPDASMAPGVARLRDRWSRDGVVGIAALASPTAPYTDPAAAQAESRALVQFLVDTRGFGALVTWLHSMSEARGWRQAIEMAYETPPEALQASFEAWLPTYLDGGWQIHALHGDDMTIVERLVEAGDYDAAESHTRAVRVLAEGDRPEAVAKAEALLERAAAGRQAGDQSSAALTALGAGDYAASLGAAQSAHDAFVALGDVEGASLAKEVERRAQLGLGAQRDLERSRDLSAWRAIEARQLSADAARAFASIGNDTARDEARSLAEGLDHRLRPAAWMLVALGLSLLVWNARQRVAERRAAQAGSERRRSGAHGRGADLDPVEWSRS